jgi:large subunit ribosomal protein L30
MQALVQIRGEIDQSAGVRDTLDMLNLGRVNHCTFVPETETYRGMVTKVNDWVAHGEPSTAVVTSLLARRGEPLEGDETVDDDWVARDTDYGSIEELAEALVAGETTLRDQGLSPTLRLHPPRGGHSGLKHPAIEGGQLGKHTTEEIDALLTAMH